MCGFVLVGLWNRMDLSECEARHTRRSRVTNMCFINALAQHTWAAYWITIADGMPAVVILLNVTGPGNR